MNAIELARAKNAAIMQQQELDKRKTQEAILAKPNEEQGRTFYARIAHSKFIFSDGVEVIFAFGRLDVNAKTFPGKFNRPTGHMQQADEANGTEKWKVYLKELNAIVPPQGNNPNIYTQDTWGEVEQLPAVTELGTINAVNETELAIADSALSRASTVRVEQQFGQVTIGGAPTSADTSSIDKDLLGAAQRNNATPMGNNQPITKIDPKELQDGNSMSSAS